MPLFIPMPMPYPDEDLLETCPVLKKLASAHRYLAELKSIVRTIPNEKILLSTLSLLEAKDSSAVENIVTTHDELFRDKADTLRPNVATKEVKRYLDALSLGFQVVRETGMLRLDDILNIHQRLEKTVPVFANCWVRS